MSANKELDAAGELAQGVIKGLKSMYAKSVQPLEKDTKFDYYYGVTQMRDAEFDAKPLILLLGQYSTGKTTFIQHMIGREIPNAHIGDEPTTDKFNVVYHGDVDVKVEGGILQSMVDFPFSDMSQFGVNFINKFQGNAVSSNVLKSMSFIDTPGVLSGKKQRKRAYDYDAVVQSFASKAAMILLFFDGAKLDVNDEFIDLIKNLRKFDNKIRLVLNKADTVAEKNLIKVYGALMFNLGKALKTPEVPKVYISSFSSKPLDTSNACYDLFEGDASALVSELKSLPRHAASRAIDKVQKRMRLVKIHALILTQIINEIPTFFNRRKKIDEIIEGLGKRFAAVARTNNISPHDFPNLDKFKAKLRTEDFKKLRSPNKKRIESLDRALERSIPSLVQQIQQGYVTSSEVEKFDPFDEGDVEEDKDSFPDKGLQKSPSLNPSVRMGKNPQSVDFEARSSISKNKGRGRGRAPVSSHVEVSQDDMRSRFDFTPERVLPIRKPGESNDWVVSSILKRETDNIFYSQKLTREGKLTGRAARKAFSSLGLPAQIMHKIWVLVDIEGTEELDADEFALAFWVGRRVVEGGSIPSELTWEMLPPSYRP